MLPRTARFRVVEEAVMLEVFRIDLPDDVPKKGRVKVRVMPFGKSIEHGPRTIQFDAGSLEVTKKVPLTIDHGTGVMDRVGVMKKFTSDEESMTAELDIADTQAGQEIRELMRIGAVTDVSAGVLMDESREFKDDNGVVHGFGALDHVSVVVKGAFGDAGAGSKVLAVHSAKEQKMGKEKMKAPAEKPAVEYATEDQVETLRKMVAEMSVPGAVQHQGHSYDTFGDMLVDVIAHTRKTVGHEDATERLTTRFDSGAVDPSGQIVQFAFPPPPGNSIGNGVAYDPYIPELAKLLRDGRPTANLFQSRALPGEGNKVFMPATTVGNIVDYQDAQGDTLANQLQVQVLTDAPKATIGGGQPVSIQAQLWTNPSYMASVAEDLVEAYSEFINGRVVNGNRIIDTPATSTGFNGIFDADFGLESSPAGGEGATDIPVTGAPEDIIPLLGTAWAAVWAGSRRQPTAAIMSANMWGALINLVDTDGRPLITVSSPMNPAGSGDAASPAGTLRGLPVVIDDAVGDTAVVVSSFRDALLYENSPSPAQLQLTYPDVLVTDISVFGFSSLFVRRPKAFAILSGITIP